MITARTGKKGERIGLLGYGAMRLPTVDGHHANVRGGGSNADIDAAEVCRHIDRCLANGINYFDTAPSYCRGLSEKVLGDALARHPRDKWFVATKLSNFAPETKTAEGARRMYEDSRRFLKTDVIDFYLLHCIGGGGKNAMKEFEERFIENGMLDFLLKERAAGRIRNLGFSFHGSEEVFRHALSLHDKVHWDFVQIQMNWVDWRHAETVNPVNIAAEKLYGWVTEWDIPVIVMEPLLGGRLARLKSAIMTRLTARDPQTTAAKWAFRFAGSHANVLTVLSGMTYMRHIEENVKTFSPLEPLSPEEFQMLERAARQFISDDAIACTACNYCMPCPYGLDIPTLFSVWNAALTEDRFPDDPKDPDYPVFRRKFLAEYGQFVPPLREAARCLGCGRCLSHCPQSIDIPAQILRVDRLVERLRRNGRA